MTAPTRILALLLLGGGLLFSDATVAASQAARIIYAYGQSTATSTDGKLRTLHKGSRVFSGETLNTRDGRLQVRFSDGGFISLQPRTRFKLEQYRFNGKEDGQESAIFSLLRGGLRAISGLIGHRHARTYQIRTSVATIGIRGTAFSARLCQGDCFSTDGVKLEDGLRTHTEDGTIFVFNDAGSLDLPAGKNSLTRDRHQLPRLSTAHVARVRAGINRRLQRLDKRQRRALLSRLQQQKQRFISGNQFNQNGQQLAINAPSSSVITGTGGVIVDAGIGTESNLDIFLTQGRLVGGIGQMTPQFHTIDMQAMLLNANPQAAARAAGFAALADPVKLGLFLQQPALAVDTGANGTVYWSRWTQGRMLEIDLQGNTTLTSLSGSQSIHTLFGRPVTSMPGGTATYAFSGGTHSTSLSGASTGAGAIGGQINVDFTTASASLSMGVRHNGSNYSVTGSMDIGPQGAFTGIIANATGGLGPCASTGCSTSIQGGLMGANAGGAGLGYIINETDPIAGVAAFKRQ